MSILVPENKYSIRLNRVLNFAQANPHKNLQLDRLADVACLSKYHFTRVFHDQIGEAPASFLRRIRLEKAAYQLAQLRHLPILSVATKCGFSSAQVFSRAFAHQFGYCPREYKSKYVASLEYREGNRNIGLMREKFRTIGIDPDMPSTLPQITVIQRPQVRVAYVRNIGRYGKDDGMIDAYEQIYNWAQTESLWTEKTELMGVSWDSSKITPDTLCRYDACIAVTDNFSRKSRISFQALPSGFYATMRIEYPLGQSQLPYWKWFFFALTTFPEFQQYEYDMRGPWIEVYRPKMPKGKIAVDLRALLHYRNAKVGIHS